MQNRLTGPEGKETRKSFMNERHNALDGVSVRTAGRGWMPDCYGNGLSGPVLEARRREMRHTGGRS
jgi:hypothetical protein